MSCDITDAARKEYNELVRELCRFVRKRDPRVAQLDRERKEAEAVAQVRTFSCSFVLS